MSVPVVWSERDEPYGDHRWRDCTYSAYLMALIYGGMERFTLGAYTVAEREALERSDDQPDETGAGLADADLASLRRYRVRLRAVGDLGAALLSPGTALVVQGQNSALPTWLRRWDPSFSGNHAVCVLPHGDGFVTWLDPEATWKFAGDKVDVATVVRWAFGSAYARVVRRDELVPALPSTDTAAGGGGDMSIFTRTLVHGTFVAAGGSTVHGYRANAAGTDWEVAKAISPDHDSSAHYRARLGRFAGTTTPSSLLEVEDGALAGLYVSTAEVAETDDPPAPVAVPCTPDQLRAQFNAGVDAAVEAAGTAKK